MYIGRGNDAISNVEKLDNITFDGSATYALTKSSAAFTPVGANNILLSMDGVIQAGNFTVSGTNIVFTGFSPTSSNTCNFILHYGTGVLNVPADGSIVAAKMAANSVDSNSYVDGSIDAVHLSANSVDSDAYVDGSIDAVHLSANSVDSDAYVDGSIDTAHIGATQVTGAKLNTDVISAQTALAVEPADTDEFMVSDAGVLKRIDYSLIKGGGTHVLLDDETTTSASSITVTGMDTTYKLYMVDILDVNFSNDADIYMRYIASGGDKTTSDYKYTGSGYNTGAGFSAWYSNGDDKIRISGETHRQDAYTSNSWRLFISEAGNTSSWKRTWWSGGGERTSAYTFSIQGSGNYRGDQDAITGLKFYPSTNTFDNIRVKLYGVT